MWSSEQRARVNLEKAVTKKELDVLLCIGQSDARADIIHCPKKSYTYYQLSVVLDDSYPYSPPALCVVEPHTLWRYGNNSTINRAGLSGDFHTLRNGPYGCVQICHCHCWDPSMTCVQVILKGFLWLDGYQEHLRTGLSIDHYFWKLREEIRQNGGDYD